MYSAVRIIICCYAVDGLTIATRLMKRVSTVTKQMKKLLCGFNEGLPAEDQMSWEAAVSIHRRTYRASVQPTASIPLEVKHEAIQKFRTSKRSLEEIMLLKQEMMNCLEYYEQKIMSLRSLQEENLSRSSDQGSRLSGSNCLISKQINISINKLSDLQKQFENILPGTLCSHPAVVILNVYKGHIAVACMHE